MFGAELRDMNLVYFDGGVFYHLLFYDFMKPSGINFFFLLHLNRDDNSAFAYRGTMEIIFIYRSLYKWRIAAVLG